jgi:hypothetical protein
MIAAGRIRIEPESMDDIDFTDPANDCFGPPEISIPVECIHCGEEYDSYRIEWRIETNSEGKRQGFWCCPIEGCDGKGFGFDIFPVDPDNDDGRFRWVDNDEEEDWEEGEYGEEEDEEWEENGEK